MFKCLFLNAEKHQGTGAARAGFHLGMGLERHQPVHLRLLQPTVPFRLPSAADGLPLGPSRLHIDALSLPFGRTDFPDGHAPLHDPSRQGQSRTDQSDQRRGGNVDRATTAAISPVRLKLNHLNPSVTLTPTVHIHQDANPTFLNSYLFSPSISRSAFLYPPPLENIFFSFSFENTF